MKCSVCGFEIEKSNQKTCPLCGNKIIREEPPVSTPHVTSSTEATAMTVPNDHAATSQPSHQDSSPATQAIIIVECPRCHTRFSEENNFCPRCGYNMRFQQDNEQEEPYQEPKHERVQQTERDSTQRFVRDIEPKLEHDEEQDDIPEAIIQEEEDFDPHANENIREENLDQFIDNGSYHPYTDDDSTQDDSQEEYHDDDDMSDAGIPATTNTSTSWLTILIASIVSLLIGALLYFITQ